MFALGRGRRVTQNLGCSAEVGKVSHKSVFRYCLEEARWGLWPDWGCGGRRWCWENLPARPCRGGEGEEARQALGMHQFWIVRCPGRSQSSSCGDQGETYAVGGRGPPDSELGSHSALMWHPSLLWAAWAPGQGWATPFSKAIGVVGVSFCMPDLCSDSSLDLSLSVAPGITNMRGSLHFFFPPCADIAVSKNKPTFFVLHICHLSPLGLDPSCLFILRWQVCSPQLKQLSCCWALTVGKPCHTQPGLLGVYPLPSVATCVGAEAGSGWIWDVLLIHPTSWKQEGNAEERKSTICQTQQWPSDFVANYHHV